MRILAFKSHHDGAIACIEDEQLAFHLEPEKNGFDRYSHITPNVVVRALSLLTGPPDVIALNGWEGGDRIQAAYSGISPESVKVGETPIVGRPGRFFSSSHERGHIIGTFGMSPFPDDTACYVLVWEGGFGSFYELDQAGEITLLEHVMLEPGERYVFLYHIASGCEDELAPPGIAGKLMALAAFSDRSATNRQEQDIIDSLLLSDFKRAIARKSQWMSSPYYKIGVETEAFKQLAGKFSDQLFNRFYSFAQKRLTKRLPLLISGGCGLNCEWNSRWRDCGLFPEIFVPPCANDTGAALGTAIDAQFILSGKRKIIWSAYAGEEFDLDCVPSAAEFISSPYDANEVSVLLAQGKVIGWVQGAYEMGPRALGHRSILAAPFEAQMRDRLNQMKQRESYRPVAPICLIEDVGQHFEWEGESPFMLFFQRVKNKALAAITHVDGTARVQTISRSQNQRVWDLLRAFRALSGVGVLCNTSLNNSGKGFINQMSDLVNFANTRELDAFVVNQTLFTRTS